MASFDRFAVPLAIRSNSLDPAPAREEDCSSCSARMHEDEIDVDEVLVRRLLGVQPPDLADWPLTLVEPWVRTLISRCEASCLIEDDGRPC